MSLKDTAEDLMACHLPWIGGAALMLFFAGFVGFGFWPFIVSSVVGMLSTIIFFTFSKNKSFLAKESPIEQEASISVEEVPSENGLPKARLEAECEQVSEVEETQEKAEAFTGEKETQKWVSDTIQDYSVRSSISLSESEAIDQTSTSEDSETEWQFEETADQNPDVNSDGSISDEDGLIEIVLPSGQYLGYDHHHEKEDPKFDLQKGFFDVFPDSILKQHSSLMDLVAEIHEMNEEDNLIEIDISMGSIKCPRFEIEA